MAINIQQSADKKIWLSAALLLSLAMNIFFAMSYISLKKEVADFNNSFKINAQVLDFTNLFIEKVLKAKTEVDFETRLKLENDVRDLKDDEILSNWKAFIESKDEMSAQENVKNLLQTLVKKVKSS